LLILGPTISIIGCDSEQDELTSIPTATSTPAHVATPEPTPPPTTAPTATNTSTPTASPTPAAIYTPTPTPGGKAEPTDDAIRTIYYLFLVDATSSSQIHEIDITLEQFAIKARDLGLEEAYNWAWKESQ